MNLDHWLQSHPLIDNILAATLNAIGYPIGIVLILAFYATIIRGIWLIWA